jgi:hypothetical protein
MNCKWCGLDAPASTGFCSDDCAESYAEEQREKGNAEPAPVIRLEPGVEGLRDRWAGLVTYAILVAAARHPRSEVHADDIRDLNVPQELRQGLNGKVWKELKRKGWLTPTGEIRRSKARARHGNPSPVYRLTDNGALAFRAMPHPPEVQAALQLVPDSVGAEAPKSHFRDQDAA